MLRSCQDHCWVLSSVTLRDKWTKVVVKIMPSYNSVSKWENQIRGEMPNYMTICSSISKRENQIRGYLPKWCWAIFRGIGIKERKLNWRIFAKIMPRYSSVSKRENQTLGYLSSSNRCSCQDPNLTTFPTLSKQFRINQIESK